MAPSRRKSASKAAAAAAARRQWKVGDLVLAKVKGFPAWPALVSEPGKWGYSTDWKKVLVHFYGTQQIAFCNPADVEAFTEEKKQSLLTKRHVKGSDFVRAVNEIIEQFEQLKQQNQADDLKSDEVAHINGGNYSSANLESKDQLELPQATHDSRFNSSHSTADGNGESLPVEDTSATALVETADKKEELADTEAVTESPLRAVYSSRKRARDLPLQNGLSQRKEPLVRRSRSSSRLESRRLQDAVAQSVDTSKRKSFEASERNNGDLSAFASSGSIEDNSSEVVTVESHSVSLNDFSTIDLGSRVEHSETMAGDVELSKALDPQIKAVTKKKRKPNRKRPAIDAVEPIPSVDKEDDFPNTSESSHNNFVKVIGSGQKEDGDEHLPLVKRARVRMGESALRESNSLTNTEGTSEETNKSSNCNDSLNRESFQMNATLHASPSHGYSQFYGSKATFWKAKKDHLFGSIEGEAALPPSKRLHRALEAMSANVAEEEQTCIDAKPDVNILTGGIVSTSMGRSPHAVTESQMPNEYNVEPIGGDSLEPDASGLAAGSNPGQNIENTSETGLNSQRVEDSNIQNNGPDKEPILDAGNHDDEKCDGSHGGVSIPLVVLTESPRHPLSSPGRKEAFVSSAQGLEEKLSPCKDNSHAERNEPINFRSEETEKESDTYEGTVMNMDPTSGAHVDDMEISPQTDTGVLQLITESTCVENSRSSNDDRVENDMSEVATEAVNKQMPKEPSSESFPNGYSGDGVGVHSSPCLTDAGNSLAQASPFNASSGRVSTSDNSSFNQNNGSCSPDVHMCDKIAPHPPFIDEEKMESAVSHRSKSVGKYAESNATLSSFEALLGSLTRTKESIGRATRLAIDCAKLGASSKVVDILARSLESEPSLHRKVDLFFLVDSIVKGDLGGLYTSSIQATLPQLLAAAAPPGNCAYENRRQCLKVLRLWLERKILSESVIRRHMRELDSYACSAAGAFSRRSLRTERSFDDPLREMEGMLVDEYGSNSSFQLPGFCMPSMLKDEDAGSDSDGGSFEAVTPEHSLEHREDHEKIPAIEKHRHILEDVDGELEMEDVAPTCETELSSSSGPTGACAAQLLQNQFEQNFSLPFAPPLPQDVPPSSPPLPSSPPPPLALPPPPPLPPIPSLGAGEVSDTYANGVDPKHYSDHTQDMPQSVTQQSNTPRNNQIMSDAVRYHSSDHRDRHRQMPESFPGRNFHNKSYPLRPPHPLPSNQFSFIRGEPHFKPRREGVPPPSNSNRYQMEQNWDRENYYNNHERMKLDPHEPDDGWRIPPHSFSGPRYPGKGKYYEPDPFSGPPEEHTRYPNQGLRYPPRSMSHRNSMPYRPPLEGPIPVSNRGPSYWQPR